MNNNGIISLGQFNFIDTGFSWIDVGMIVAYLVGITIFGFYYQKKVKTSEDYFLAGKSLPWWIIGMSIIGTNIGSNDYVGAAGSAYKIGIAQANFEWIGAIPAMIISAFIFIPFYWRAGVYSIPEYLGKRYNDAVRVISASVLTIFSFLIVAAFLWAVALMLGRYFGWPPWFSIAITFVVVGFYTISGGLGAVAITDSIQLVIMFAGAIIVAVIGFNEIGGIDNFITHIQTHHPSHLQTFLPSTDENFPWPGVLMGLAFVLSPAYWCANQAILQRTMGARTEWDGRASMILAAVAKTFIPFLIVLPGFFALILCTEMLPQQDQALPWVIQNLLPAGVSGLMFVAFLAALQSSIDSTMNSAAVMMTRDILGILYNKDRTDHRDLVFGKIFSFLVLVLSVPLVFVVVKYEGIFTFVQDMLSLFQGPMLALILLGILYRRGTAAAGLASLLSGLSVSALLKLFDFSMYYIAFWSFVFSVLVIFTVSYFTKQKSDEELENLTYATTVKGVK